jgi:hypothetical protein
MVVTVHRPLRVVAFNANGIGRQAYDVRKYAMAKNRCGPFLGDTPETTYEVLHTELPYISN